MANYKTLEDYKNLAEEQAEALKILNKRLRDKEKEIMDLHKRIRTIIKSKRGGNFDTYKQQNNFTL